jgi:cyclophilin family peptidyl-prolyl cis-trans isomerase
MSHIDGKHVVFGKVISGQGVVSAIEQVGSESGRTRVQGAYKMKLKKSEPFIALLVYLLFYVML